MVHLGDGVHTDHFYFIAEMLEAEPGSKEHARDVEARQRRALRAREGTVKPPSANVAESEFSHLLGAVMQANGGIGAAVFDTHGLKVGAAGVQLESMVLPDERLAAVIHGDPAQDPTPVRYSCERLAELASSCDRTATRGVPCWDAEAIASDCRAPLLVYYRAVRDYRQGSPIVRGVSMLVVRETPRCR